MRDLVEFVIFRFLQVIIPSRRARMAVTTRSSPRKAPAPSPPKAKGKELEAEAEASRVGAGEARQDKLSRGWSKLVLHAPRTPGTGRGLYEKVADPADWASYVIRFRDRDPSER